ncbi:MAG: hypothetical protein IT539_13745 [Bradyrhizobiaceae bacterium]|nr:hypothetical protein [Bradyrhizobiaceae bacterium]
MTGNANLETQGTTKKARHAISRLLLTLYYDHRIRMAFRVLATLACIFTLLHAIHTSPDFQRAKDASQALSDRFAKLAPAAFVGAIEKRRLHCDYSWLFFCNERPSPNLRNLNTKCLVDYQPMSNDFRSTLHGICSGFFRVVQFPDAAIYVLRENFAKDLLSGVMTGLFVMLVLVLNYPVLTKAPVALPFVFPMTIALASGLYWVLEFVFLGTVFVAYAVYGLLLWIAAWPKSLVRACEGVAKATELTQLRHEVRELWQQAYQLVQTATKTRF